MTHSDVIQSKRLDFAQGALCYDTTRFHDPSPALFDPANPELNAIAVGHGGRQAAWFVHGEFGRAVLRHYRRGGAVARISADRYIWRGASATRSMAEFRVLSRMYSRGLPVPRPLAAAYWRQGLGYRAAIMIERVDDSRTLTQFVRSGDPSGDWPQIIAQSIFFMHEAGFWHADLNAYNILLDAHGKAWLIDFDKAREGRLSSKNRINNLKRLRRSLIKVAQSSGDLWWKDINRAYGALQVAKNALAD